MTATASAVSAGDEYVYQSALRWKSRSSQPSSTRRRSSIRCRFIASSAVVTCSVEHWCVRFETIRSNPAAAGRTSQRSSSYSRTKTQTTVSSRRSEGNNSACIEMCNGGQRCRGKPYEMPAAPDFRRRSADSLGTGVGTRAVWPRLSEGNGNAMARCRAPLRAFVTSAAPRGVTSLARAAHTVGRARDPRTVETAGGPVGGGAAVGRKHRERSRTRTRGHRSIGKSRRCRRHREGPPCQEKP